MVTEVEKYIESRKEILEKVKKEIIERLNVDLSVEEIDDEVALFGTGLGLDSVDALDLILGIETVFGVTIKENNIAVFKSVNALTDYIMQKKGEQ